MRVSTVNFHEKIDERTIWTIHVYLRIACSTVCPIYKLITITASFPMPTAHKGVPKCHSSSISCNEPDLCREMEEEGGWPGQAGARHGDPAVRHRRHPQEDLQRPRGLWHAFRRHRPGEQYSGCWLSMNILTFQDYKNVEINMEIDSCLWKVDSRISKWTLSCVVSVILHYDDFISFK